MKDLSNIWLLKRGRDSNIEAFGIIDITVVVAIVVAIVKVEFGGVCGCARCLRTYSRREYGSVALTLGQSSNLSGCMDVQVTRITDSRGRISTRSRHEEPEHLDPNLVWALRYAQTICHTKF